MKNMSDRLLRFVDGQGFSRLFHSRDQKRLERRATLPWWTRHQVTWVMRDSGLIWVAFGRFGRVFALVASGGSKWRLMPRDLRGTLCEGTMSEVHAALREAWGLESRESFDPVGVVHG